MFEIFLVDQDDSIIRTGSLKLVREPRKKNVDPKCLLMAKNIGKVL
tara:strand:- start:43218 stop:43355 length:138 start_codon:yes stop_codon:yes gene_type:complete